MAGHVREAAAHGPVACLEADTRVALQHVHDTVVGVFFPEAPDCGGMTMHTQKWRAIAAPENYKTYDQSCNVFRR